MTTAITNHDTATDPSPDRAHRAGAPFLPRAPVTAAAARREPCPDHVWHRRRAAAALCGGGGVAGVDTMNEAYLKRLVETFSAVLQSPVIVAGGAVRDTLRNEQPKDYDVFMLGQSWDDWDEYKSTFAARVVSFPSVVSQIEWHKSEPFLIETITFEGNEVQILATPCKTAEELIATFDWGCCCFAYNGEKFVYDSLDLDAITTGEHLRLNKLTFPFSTLRRGYRFSERFLMRIKREDIITICKAILGKAQTSETAETE